MKKLSLLFLLLAAASYAKSQTMILLKDAGQYVGKNVSICDSVYSTKAFDKLTLINLGGAYPKELLTVVINKADEHKFPSDPASMFMANNICVTGVVSDFKGKKQIVVTDPKQIVVK